MSSLVSLWRWREPVALAVSTALIMTHLAPPILAQPEQDALKQARAQFQQATEMEQAGNWAAALQLFREVGSVRMTPQVRYHIALCEENLGRLVPALGGYELALAEADTVGPAFRTEVETSIELLRARVPKVIVERGSGAEAATIELDGVVLGSSSIGVAVTIDPGPHTIRAAAPEHETFTTTINVEESSTETIRVELVPVPEETEAKPVPSDAPTAAPTEPKGFVVDRDFWMYTAFGAGGAFLIGSGVSFLMKSQKERVVEDICGADWDCGDDEPLVRFNRAKDAGDAASTYGTLGFVSIGLAAAGVGLGTYLYLTRTERGASESSARIWHVTASAPGADLTGISFVARY